MNKILISTMLLAIAATNVSAASISTTVNPATSGGHVLGGHSTLGQSFVAPAASVTAGIYVYFSPETATILSKTDVTSSTVTASLFRGESIDAADLITSTGITITDKQNGYIDVNYADLGIELIPGSKYTITLDEPLQGGWIVPAVCSTVVIAPNGQPTGFYLDGHPFLQGEVVLDETGICDTGFHVIDNANPTPVDPTPVDPTPEEIIDTTAPVIVVNGGDEEILVGTFYTDAGATCTDETDATCDVAVTNTVDTNTAGTYAVEYSATDVAGNTSTATRNVTVVLPPDTEAPKITLIGNGTDTVFVEEALYNDAGATCTDNVDSTCTVTQNSIYINVPGTKTITYTATDKAGNIATATRTVTITTKPAPTPTLTPGQKVTGYAPYGGVGYDILGTYRLFGGVKVYIDSRTKMNTTNKDKLYIPYSYYYDATVRNDLTLLATKIYSSK